MVKNSLSSENDTEIIDLKLKGNRSGDIGQSLLLGITQNTPTSSVDNILFATSFDRGGYLGWVRTTDSGQPWQKFGPISKDANTEHYVIDKLAIAQSDAGTGKVLGVTGDVDITGGIEVSGVSTTGQLEAGTAKVSDLTSGRVVITGTGGELEDSSSLTFSGATLTSNTLNVTNNVTATNVSASGTVQGEHLKSTDDAEITDDLTVGGNITVSGSHTVSGNIQTTGSVTGASANITGTATASTFVGAGTIPVGGIIMWSGAAVPANFAICDGTSGTPDLRDRFIVGSGNLYSIDNTGGSKDAVAVAHSHTVTDPGHRHTQSGGGTQDDGGSNVPGSTSGGTQSNIADATTGITLSSGGVSGTDKNLPPYYALAFIMRIS